MRHNWYAKFAGKEQDSKDLVDTTNAASIRLEHRQRSSLQELLEHDTVLAHLTSRYANRAMWCIGECFADRGMAQDIVRGSWFLDEPWLELR